MSAVFREYMFDEKDKKHITFDGAVVQDLSLAIKEFSLICDRKGFADQPEWDGKEFDRFTGTIDADFTEEGTSRSRHLTGTFKLAWKRENRGS